MEKTPEKEPWEVGVWGAGPGEVQDEGRGGRAAQPGAECGLLRAAASLLEGRDQIFCKHRPGPGLGGSRVRWGWLPGEHAGLPTLS